MRSHKVLIAVRAHASFGRVAIDSRSLASLAERSSTVLAWDSLVDSALVVPLAHLFYN